MTSELDRRDHSLPAWMACWFFGLLLLGLAVAEYLYVTDYEKAGGHPPVEARQERSIRRSPFAHVAEWGYPHVGVWGCVAIFAAPGAALVAGGEWLRRRKRMIPTDA
jgi:hypothetical protein